MPGCPDSQCRSQLIKKDGHYFRKNDSRSIQRFRCNSCGKKFSRSTFELECGQKKRRVNHPLFKLMCSNVSQRRAALLLNVHKTTIARKFQYLGEKYRLKNQIWRQSMKEHSILHVQFDDLITIEHTKLKPLTVTAAINAHSREILAVKVGKIPAFGHLAKLARKKYGVRENQHLMTLGYVFQKIQPLLNSYVMIESDDHTNYPKMIRRFAPTAQHIAHKGGRSSIYGQGELKRLEYDPLFGINHTYAMFRGNINRLIRKSWCTTKIPEKLQLHLEMYMWFHNHYLL